MKKHTIITLIIGAAVVAATGVTAYVLTRPVPVSVSDSMEGMLMPADSMMTSSTTYKQYANLSGEEYDKTFLANMTMHHQGAIDMASLAAAQSKHVELKTLAANIIKAQTDEIANMMSWQVLWGYVAKGSDPMMNTSSLATMTEMSGMTNELRKLSGNEFDKKFIALMIQHHQAAINMATPGVNNAYHQEVKNLTKAIVTAQSSEIKQMLQWQKDWGYTN